MSSAVKQTRVSDRIVYPVNPHFDHQRVIWKDEYSGEYQPVPYDEQFDYQWELFLKKRKGFFEHTGVETSDPWIDERIRELTGVSGFIEGKKFGPFGFTVRRMLRKIMGYTNKRMGVGGRLYLEPQFPIDHFTNKRCLDLGCGAGRWTRALMELGASVKSVDVSENGLASVRRYNGDVERLDLFDIISKRPDLHGVFDFSLCWGVVMCTHDPKRAFENVAATVKPGGELYVMVYAPTYHNSPAVLEMRKHFHRSFNSPEEKLSYVYSIADRAENAINYLDMLNTFYNWVIEKETVMRWFHDQGFTDVVHLNAREPHPCAHHILGRKMCP